MKVMISKSMPKWLVDIIKTIKADKLTFVQKSSISMYLSTLPKTQVKAINIVDSQLPQDFLDSFNAIDFTKIDAEKEKTMKSFITKYVKENKLV